MASRHNSSPIRCPGTARRTRSTSATWTAAGWSGWRSICDKTGRKFPGLLLAVAFGRAAPPQRPYHFAHYDVGIVVDMRGKRLAGEVTLSLRSLMAPLRAVE